MGCIIQVISYFPKMKEHANSKVDKLPQQLILSFQNIVQHIQEIETYFTRMSIKSQQCLKFLYPQQGKRVQQPIETLIHLIHDFNEHIHKLIKEINPKLNNLQSCIVQNWSKEVIKHQNDYNLFEIPVQVDITNEIPIYEQICVQQYFSQIKCWEDVPMKLKNIIMQLTQSKQSKQPIIYEIPLELQLQEYSKELSFIKSDILAQLSQKQTPAVDLTFQNQLTPICKPFQFEARPKLLDINSIQVHEVNSPTDSNQPNYTGTITASFNHEQQYYKDNEIDTPNLNQLQTKSDTCYLQNTQFNIKISEQHLVLQKESQKKRHEQDLCKNFLYEVPVEMIGGSPEKLQLFSQVYSFEIRSSTQKFSTPQFDKNELKFSVSRKKQDQNWSNKQQKKNSQLGVGIFNEKNKYFDKLSDTYLIPSQQNLGFSKRISIESFQQNEFGSPNQKNNDFPTPTQNNNMNWSASIQSFVIGNNNNATKTLAQSENYNIIRKIKPSNGSEGDHIKQQQSHQGHDNYLRISIQNKTVEPINTAKKQSLTKHPQLNFCGSSEINQHNSPNQQASKTQSFLKSFHAPENSLSLKLKQSFIIPQNNSNKCIDPTGSIYGSLAELALANKNKVELNKKKSSKVYIIQAQSSSQGSHTDREMYISNIKKNNPISPQPIPQQHQSSENSSCSYWKYPKRQQKSEISIQDKVDDEQQISGLIRPKNTEQSQQQKILEQYYQLKQYKTILQQEKTLFLEQLHKSEEQVQKLKQEVSTKQQEKIDIQKCYKQKLHKIIDQISLYQNKLKSMEEQLKNKIDSQTNLKAGLQQALTQIKALQDQLSKKQEIIDELQNLAHQVSKQYHSQKQLHQKSKCEKNKMIEQLSSQYASGHEILIEQSQTLKHKNMILQKQIEQLKKLVDIKNDKLQKLQNQYQGLLKQMQQFEEANMTGDGQKQYWQIYHQEISKAHQKYQILIQQKIITINKLQANNQELTQFINNKNSRITELQAKIQQNQNMINQMGISLQDRADYKKNLIDMLPIKAQQQIQYLRNELVLAQKKLEYFKSYKKDSLLTIQFNEYNEKNIQQINQFEKYVQNLENMVLEYESIIKKNYSVIKQLQDRVYEYLRDALRKQSSQEKLYEELLESEHELNQILLQKISIEIQNKKMKKMIAASQKKLSSIGTRLIKAARTKLKDYSRQTSNQTQKYYKGGLTNNKTATNKIKRTLSRQNIQDILLDTMNK